MNKHTRLLTYLKFTSDLPDKFTEGTDLSIQLLYIFTKNITKIWKKKKKNTFLKFLIILIFIKLNSTYIIVFLSWNFQSNS